MRQHHRTGLLRVVVAINLAPINPEQIYKVVMLVAITLQHVLHLHVVPIVAAKLAVALIHIVQVHCLHLLLNHIGNRIQFNSIYC
jgi:hypothetical protein